MSLKSYIRHWETIYSEYVDTQVNFISLHRSQKILKEQSACSIIFNNLCKSFVHVSTREGKERHNKRNNYAIIEHRLSEGQQVYLGKEGRSTEQNY